MSTTDFSVEQIDKRLKRMRCYIDTMLACSAMNADTARLFLQEIAGIDNDLDQIADRPPEILGYLVPEEGGYIPESGTELPSPPKGGTGKTSSKRPQRSNKPLTTP